MPWLVMEWGWPSRRLLHSNSCSRCKMFIFFSQQTAKALVFLEKISMKGIPKEIHGYADYMYVPFVLAAPKALNFENEKAVASICYAHSALVLGYTLLTDANWGIIKVIPYEVHLKT